MNKNLTEDQYMQINNAFYNLSYTLHHFMVKSKAIELSTLINAFLNFSAVFKSDAFNDEKVHTNIKRNIKLFTWINEEVWSSSTQEYIHKLQVHTEFDDTVIILQQISESLRENKKTENKINDISDILFLNNNIIEEDELIEATVLLSRDIKDSIQIGRGLASNNDIVLGENDMTVSRVHLKIIAHKQGYFIEDVSSMGTYVDGVKIEKNVKKYIGKHNLVRLGNKKTILDLSHLAIKALHV